MKSRRSKATDISPAVKRAVYERDNGLCVVCGRPGAPNAHVISRAKGGLGVEENIVTLCMDCHRTYDQGNRCEREYIGGVINNYLKLKYGHIDPEKVIYKKENFL